MTGGHRDAHGPHKDAASPHMAHVAPQGCTGRHRAHSDAQRHMGALITGGHRDAGHACRASAGSKADNDDADE